MAKVLISLIGTGRIAKGDSEKNEYQTTDYIIENQLYKNNTLVSSALIKHYDIETIFFIGTKQSMWDNLCYLFEANDEYTLSLLEKKEQNKVTEKDLIQLSNTINKKQNSTNSKCIIIEDSEKEEHLWNMFDKFLDILDALDKRDELYFDITHLFRSVSVLSMITAQFARISYDFKISGIFYGLLKKDGPSNIVNLSVFFELLDWARAINYLKKFGNSFELVKLLEQTNESNELKNSFKNFSDALSISDIGALQNSIKQLKGKINLFKEHDSHFIKLISTELQDFIKRLDINSLAKFQFELTKWYEENHNYSFAYLTLTEAIISAICEENNLDPISTDDRREAKNIIWEYGDYKKSDKKKQEINDIYHKVNNIRINIAHKTPAQGSKTKIYPSQSIENLSNYIKKVAILFK